MAKPMSAVNDAIAAASASVPAVPVATAPVKRDAELWRWFRERVFVSTTEDGEIYLSVLVGEPADVGCLTLREQEMFENDSPDPKDMSALCQRIAEWHSGVLDPTGEPTPALPSREIEGGNFVRFIDMVRGLRPVLCVADGSYSDTQLERVWNGILALIPTAPTGDTPE